MINTEHFRRRFGLDEEDIEFVYELGSEEPIAALRFNEGKPSLHYVLYYKRFLEAIARVQEQGEIKYGYGNWLYGNKPDREYWDSAMRHIVDAFSGDTYDDDSGCMHIAHAIWNLIQILELNSTDPVFDPEFDQDSFVERWSDAPKQPNSNL